MGMDINARCIFLKACYKFKTQCNTVLYERVGPWAPVFHTTAATVSCRFKSRISRVFYNVHLSQVLR